MWILIIITLIILAALFCYGAGKQNKQYDKIFEEPPKEYKYKTPFDAKLIELGVKEQWDTNRQNYCDASPNSVSFEAETFYSFIRGYFDWETTPEGKEFWSEISKK